MARFTTSAGQRRYYNDKDINFNKRTIKTHVVKDINEKIEFESKEMEFIAPLGVTVNAFGDFEKSNNALKHKITNIKRPKKRKAKQNAKIENALDNILSMGALWENATKQKLTNTQTQNNKRKNKRK